MDKVSASLATGALGRRSSFITNRPVDGTSLGSCRVRLIVAHHSAQHDSLVTSLRNAWAPILSASLIVG